MTTTSSSPPFVQWGAMLMGSPESGARTSTLPESQKMLDILKAHKVDLIDTARMYGDGTSEEYLGNLDAEGQGFKISTKIFPLLNSPMASLRGNRSNNDYTHSAKDIHHACEASLKALKQKKCDIYYLHSPDKKVPYEETLAAINEEYKAGHFERFGISNYTAEDVQKIVDLCDEKSWVKPTVYQGMYNALNRSSENKLLPVLRKNNISFVSYSPLAGGLFAMKDEDEAVESGKRFDKNGMVGKMYRGLYWHENYFKVLKTLRPLAEKHNIGMIELAIRWCQYHSALDGKHGDMLLLGSSSTNQLEANLVDIEKGPLPKELADAMEDAWESLKDTAFAMEERFG